MNWRTATVLFAALLFPAPLLCSQNYETLGDATAFSRLANGVEIAAQSGRLRVEALSPNVVRVRYALHGDFSPGPSFAVLPNAFPQAPVTSVEETAPAIILKTDSLQVKILRSPLRLQFLNTQGDVVSEDQPGSPVSFHGSAFEVRKAMPEDEHYFGLGDKSGPLDHRNLAFTMWNTDAYGWQESTDPLYKDIPFFLGMRPGGSAYGIFLDNTFRTWFDFGKTARHSYSFGSDGGQLDYYFFYGPGPKRVIEDFTALVGRTPLPPLFALGYQQCRYSYYPESRVREVAAEFRKRKIPADTIYLDIDYQQNNRPFTIDRERFPTFEQLIADLKKEGFKVIAITDLHIAKVPGSKPYDEGLKNDYFVKNPDGSVYVGKVWPGESVFPDFTREAARRFWGSLYSDFVGMGLRGFWNDMNEPAVFLRLDKTMPPDTVHSVEGRKTDHREIHNVFGMENARATYEGLLRLQPDVRPFVLTRAAYAGTQRYASTWTGDNSATWNHMRISIPQLLNLGVSGYSFVGDDIGGFAGSPSVELLTRWMQLGAFNPIYRNHGEKGSRNREPWVDGPQQEAIRRRYIELRYQLLPYIYTGMEESSRTGIPLMRPLFLEFPESSTLLTTDSEFMFGEDFLIAPKLQDSPVPYDVSLPPGTWYDYWTGSPVESGKFQVNPGLDSVPIYVRGGAIIPEQAVIQNTDELPHGPLRLLVYPGAGCRGSLYQDDGNTFAYSRGEFLRMQFSCESSPESLHLSFTTETAKYKPSWQSMEVIFHGIDHRPRQATQNGMPIANGKFDAAAKTFALTIEKPQSGEVLISK